MLDDSSFASANDVRRYVQKSLNCRDVYVQAVLEEACLLLVFNVHERSKISYGALTEKLLPFLEGHDFLGATRLIIYGRTLGLEECDWQTELSLPITKQTKPFPLAKKRYRNALEPIVARKVYSYLDKDFYILSNSEIAQVIAYSLNRFKPMYATSIQGWEVVDSLSEELDEEIDRTLLQGIEIVRASPYEIGDKPSLEKVQTHAHILAQLNKLLGRKNLRWRDIPAALQYRLEDRKAWRNNKVANQIKSYLKRSVQRELSTEFLPMADFGIVQVDWFAVYMSVASGDYLNALEPIIFELIESKIQEREDSAILEKNLNELMAYILNRLPAMYATTQRGVEWVREWVLENLEEKIEPLLEEALEKFGQLFLDEREPMPLDRFEQEAEFAFKEIKQLLKRFDISWDNLLDLIETELSRRNTPQGY